MVTKLRLKEEQILDDFFIKCPQKRHILLPLLDGIRVVFSMGYGMLPGSFKCLSYTLNPAKRDFASISQLLSCFFLDSAVTNTAEQVKESS